jgi:hypothetical protein
MLWWVDAEDSSIKELAGSGTFHPVNLLWLDGGSSLKEVSLGFFSPILLFFWLRCWRFILRVVGLGFLHRLMLWWVDAGGSSKMELTSMEFLHRVILLWSDEGSSLKELSFGFFRPLMFLWVRCWRFILDIVSLGFLHPHWCFGGWMLEVHP